MLSFLEAFQTFHLNLTADDDDDGDEDNAKQPSCSDYVMHFITIFWKVLFAFVPPTSKFISFD